MKKHPTIRLTHPTLAWMAAGLAVSSTALAQVATNWVAFNEHRPTAGVTHPNATGIEMRAVAGAPVTGVLKDFFTGLDLPVMLIVTATDTPDDFGANNYPNPGTPAYNLFNGILDVGNSGIVGLRQSAGSTVTLTFTNLDPSKRYIFRGTVVRGNNYSDRWAVYSLLGVESFVDAHVDASSNNNLITKDEFPSAALTNGQVALNCGENRDGSLVGWDEIDPGPDGAFSIHMAQYRGPTPFGDTIGGNAPYGYGLTAIMLAEVGPPSPVEITQQPADVTVEELRSFTLSVVAVGSPPPTYQWYRTDLGPIAGATGRLLTITNASLGDSGDYYVVVSNPINTVTSRVATVTVVPDTTPPALVHASADATFTQVAVDFSEPVEALSSSDPFNYFVSSGLDVLSVVAVQLVGSGRSVVLTVDPAMAENTAYTVTVSGVRDLVGNAIPPESSFTFTSWVRSTNCGALFFEHYDTGGGTAISGLTNHPSFPDQPVARFIMTRFDTREIYTDDSHDNYGARIRGVFIPPTSGDWRFFLRSDDASLLYLNPNGPSANGKELIAWENDCCDPFENPGAPETSDPIPLVAGQAYYIEALYKEGGGADYCQVAARLEGDTTPPADLQPIPGEWLGYPAAPAELGDGLQITQQPQDVTVSENALATFTVEATHADGLPVCVQWQRDDGFGFLDIAGATEPEYAFRPTLADNGTQFRAVVSSVGRTINSDPALLTVVFDEVPPAVLAVRGSRNLTNVIVEFSELIDPFSAQDPFNYAVGFLTVIEANVRPDGSSVVLTVEPATEPDTTYEVTVSGVTDLAGNQMAMTNLTLHTFVLSPFFAVQELFFNIGGTAIADLTGSPKYPNEPDRVDYISLLEGPTDTYDNYGTQLTGWIVPPVDGEYVFYMCSDDNGEFWLSTDDSPANLQLVAQETSWNAARTWTGDRNGGTRGSPPSNISQPIFMVGGQRYYFMARAKEAGGGDNLGVAWQIPGDPVPQNGDPPISGAYLMSLADPTGAQITIEQQPTDQTAAVLPRTVSEETFDDNSGGFHVVSTGPLVGPWEYDANSGVWAANGSTPECTQPTSSALISPTYRATQTAIVTLTLRHRYSFEFDGTTRWDGGQIRVSINGGPFTPVSQTSLSGQVYDGVITGSGVLNGQQGFNGTSPGYATGAYVTTTAMLGRLKAGDTIAIEFLGAWDQCTVAAQPNWVIDSIQLSPPLEVVGAESPVTFSVRVSASTATSTNPPVFYQWQRADGGDFVNIRHANAASYTLYPTLGDDGAQFRCLVGIPGASVFSDVATLSVQVGGAAPALEITRVGDQVVIAWPAPSTGWKLQETTALLSPPENTVWVEVPGTPTVVGGQNVMTLPATGPQKFYRLMKP